MNALNYPTYEYAIVNADGKFYAGANNADKSEWVSHHWYLQRYNEKGAHVAMQSDPDKFKDCKVIHLI